MVLLRMSVVSLNSNFYQSIFSPVETVIKNHYVDFLDSVDSVGEAVTLVEQVQQIHAAALFPIRENNV